MLAPVQLNIDAYWQLYSTVLEKERPWDFSSFEGLKTMPSTGLLGALAARAGDSPELQAAQTAARATELHDTGQQLDRLQCPCSALS